MEQAGVVADVVVYSGLLDACAKAGDLVRAKEVFARTGLHKVTCKPHQTASSRAFKDMCIYIYVIYSYICIYIYIYIYIKYIYFTPTNRGNQIRWLCTNYLSQPYISRYRMVSVYQLLIVIGHLSAIRMRMVWVCRLDTADLLFGSAALVKVMEFCCFDLQMQRIQFSFGTSQGPGKW